MHPIAPLNTMVQAISQSTDEIQQKLPSLMNMRLFEWIASLTHPTDGAFPNGISRTVLRHLAVCQMSMDEEQAHASFRKRQLALWNSPNHLNILLQTELKLGRIERLKNSLYVGVFRDRITPGKLAKRACAKCLRKCDDENLLACLECKLVVHPHCYYGGNNAPQKIIRDSFVRENWRCFDCKACHICGQKDQPNNGLLLCDECDFAEHMDCQMPALKDVPPAPWHCTLCRQPIGPVSPDSTMEKAKKNFDRLIVSATEDLCKKVEVGSRDRKTDIAPLMLSITRTQQEDQPRLIKATEPAQETRKRKSEDENLVTNGNFEEKRQKVTTTGSEPESVKHSSKSEQQTCQKIEDKHDFSMPTLWPAKVECDAVASIKRWSPKQTQEFIEKMGLVEAARAVGREEIDGAALLMLERSDILRYLGLKVGPALKLYELVAQIKCLVFPS